MDCALWHRGNVLPIRSVPVMRSASSRESVFAHRPTSWIPRTTTSARAPVNDSRAALMPSVHPQIHRNVCARRDSREIPCWAARMRTSAPICPAPMEPTV